MEYSSNYHWIDKPNQLFKVNSFELIGMGGFGKVYKHRYELDNQMYAIKKILITEYSAASALKEVRILSGLNHINIIRYMTSWIEEQSLNKEDSSDEDMIYQRNGCIYYLCIKMEYCQSTLSKYLFSRSDFNLNYHYIRQIFHGVKYLHDLEIIHRDLKPDNILISQDQIIKITDFGLVKTKCSKDMMDSSYAGTYLYSSPEQYNGLYYSFDTDIFSLGIIIYEMFHMFKTEMEKIENILKFRSELKISSYIDKYEIILKMIGPRSDRPTIQNVLEIFYPSYDHDSYIICRDIVWGLIFRAI